MKKLFLDFMQLSNLLKITLVISLILFLISLTQPAFFIDRKDDPNAYSNSFILFLLGWMSFLGGAFIPFVVWLANPLFLLSIFLSIRKKNLGFITALGSTCLAIIFSQFTTVITSESGSSSIITGFGLGFKLWLSSFMILTMGLLINHFYEK
ncbi:MAG: hypothetical protein U0T80_03530 [Flavobacteriaceae bacterium]